jgi:hypothetical protein
MRPAPALKAGAAGPTKEAVATALTDSAPVRAHQTDGRPMQLSADQPIRDSILMSIEPISPTPFPTPGPGSGRAPVRPPEELQRAAEAREKTPEAAPTPKHEVVRAASKAVETIRETARSLHFESTDTGLRIEVYDAEGKLVRAIPPNETMARTVNGGLTWRA